MISIRLPDGSSRSYDPPVTPAQIASSIGPGLAKAALAARVDGKLVDVTHLIERDADVAIVTERDVLRAPFAASIGSAMRETAVAT